MRADVLFRVLFILYCFEAGIFLVLAPWSPMWARTLAQLPLGSFYGILVHPAMRGGVTGFGLVHLVWGAHDLGHLLFRRRRNARADV
jgi:hypothetical protein